MEKEIFENHSIIIDNRKSVDMTGVKEVISFDDETIILDSLLGKITVKGENLHIFNFNNETGDFKATGKVHGVIYINDSRESRGFVSRLFK